MNKELKYGFVLGTRPEIIKLYSLLDYMHTHNYDFFVIHTHQHYTDNMDGIFFEELSLPIPKYNLSLSNESSDISKIAYMMQEIEKKFIIEKPDVVFVQGDTNSVLAGGLTTRKMNIKLAHIEAGLRSYDMNMPEEINRKLVDTISDYLFVPTQGQRNNLIGEGLNEKNIFIVGNTIADAVSAMKNSFSENNIFQKYNIQKDNYLYLTLHRQSNVDNIQNLDEILQAVIEISEKNGYKILFPIHPRTRKNITTFGKEELLKKIQVIDPVPFGESIFLQSRSVMVLTDSGGIQEESCILQKKTLILRDNTERPETLDVGGAILVGTQRENIISGYNELITKQVNWYNPFGDGKSYEKILNSF